MNNLAPDAVVIVATIRALKQHGGVAEVDLNNENLKALKQGLQNLQQHINVVESVFNQNVVVALNRFPSDTEVEINLLKENFNKTGIKASLSEVWEKGGEGGLELAEQVIALCEEKSKLHFPYSLSDNLKLKIKKIATSVYKADDVVFTKLADRKIKEAEDLGYDKIPVCMAKTQYSFSDDPTLLGAPENFKLTVRDIRISAGAGFIVALTGDIMTMPGLPKVPAAEAMTINEYYQISGLM